jgi:hypothetical protein
MVMVIFYLYFPMLQPQHWPYILTIAFVLAVLVYGRRYPWLFAALGGFLLGQIIGKLFLANWNPSDLFWVSAALGATLGALTLLAERPVMAVASFSGVGFLAYTWCEIFGLGSPLNLIAYAVAGGLAVVALFRLPFDRALIFLLALSVAGAISATLFAWIFYVRDWHQGFSAVVIGAIAAVVAIIHQMRELPASDTSSKSVGVLRHAA